MAVLLKNLYNKEYISLLAQSCKKAYPSFDVEAFMRTVFDATFNDLELKQRMRHISKALKLHISLNYQDSIKVLKEVFSSMNHSFYLENMIFQDYVEVFGLEYFSVSVNALEYFTLNSSSEFAIRRFIIKYPKKTMKQMLLWAVADNHHVRRLASEGSRSRLPWAIALNSFKKDPSEVLVILELLKDDSSEYVRRSVANNLNDISKDNPELLKELTKKWINHNKNRDALLKHACRTLLKKSDTEVLKLFGFSQPKNIKLENFEYRRSLKMGEEFDFSFDLLSTEQLGTLRLEFSIDFLRKNGKHNTKVFKISEGKFTQKEKRVQKSYSFKKISTRVYYKGIQRVTIIINGVPFVSKEFELL